MFSWNVTDNLEVFAWYGWNANTCLVNYFNTGKNRNLGFTILPLHFWRCIGFRNYHFGYENRRIWIGLGILEIFWDIKESSKE
jgi:hypothetical protein